ncbi:MAG: hypothetical protein J7L15_02265 [Clostridiales bacterium]|nr:hypothetical protein [Clostridiales bacterium]
MNRVVYSPSYGGYGLSSEALKLFNKLNKDNVDYTEREIPRHHPILIEVVETLGSAASDKFAKLQIKEILGFQYVIEEYDGWERVATPEDDMEWIEINSEYSRKKWPEYFI